MMNTLLGVGIGYLIFKWADSEPINTPNGDENDSEPLPPTRDPSEAVWTLESISNAKMDENSGVAYACGTYTYPGEYRSYIVVQASAVDAPLSEWTELMGADGSIAYTFLNKSDCVQMVDMLTAAPTPDDPVKPPEPEPLPIPDYDFGGMVGFGTAGVA